MDCVLRGTFGKYGTDSRDLTAATFSHILFYLCFRVANMEKKLGYFRRANVPMYVQFSSSNKILNFRSASLIFLNLVHGGNEFGGHVPTS